MNNRNRPIIFSPIFIFLSFIIITNCSSEDKTETQKGNLNLAFSFPDEQSDHLLSGPVSLVLNDNELFISDWRQSSILVFDHEGNYRRKIGGEGRGPREFMQQNLIRLNNGKLFVKDQGNRRISIIDIQNDTSYVEVTRKFFDEFAVSKDRIYAFLSYRGVDNVDSLSLIKVYDHNLNQVNSFGKFLNITGNMDIWASGPHLALYDNKLYVQFATFPILRVYTLDGERVREMNLTNPNASYKARIEKNYDAATYEENSTGPSKLLYSFDINQAGLFLNIYDEHTLIIDHFDHEGNFIRRYKRDIDAEDYYIRDFKVMVGEEGTLNFYVLNITDGFPKVDVYEAQTDNK